MTDTVFMLVISAIFGGLVVLLWRVGLEKEKRREYERNKEDK